MLDVLLDPYMWAAFAIFVVVAVVFGRMRHDPWWAVAVTAVGATTFLLGLRWAGNIGNEAFWAAALASGGTAAWAEMAGLSRKARVRGEPESPS